MLRLEETSVQPREVEKLPRPLDLPTTNFAKLTHYMYRYPAKFHPPVVAALLEKYSIPGDTVLDPFCGSGTFAVEAMRLHRNSVGLDVDPVAVAVAAVKVHRYNITQLRGSAEQVMSMTQRLRRSKSEYESRMFQDLSATQFTRSARELRQFIPAIPNIDHWFRKYVTIDLARLRRTIESASIPETHRAFLFVVFVSIVRNCSNADPVPVSGLEVTSYMLRRDAAGRVIDPFALFSRALDKALDATQAFAEATDGNCKARIREGDATNLDRAVRGSVDCVITSPPYHGAVDYYRRHQLEMFWLGAVNSQGDRLVLLDRYIGRPAVPLRDPRLHSSELHTPIAKEWEQRIRQVSSKRANAFLHYIASMTLFFEGLAPHLEIGAPAVLVLGHSMWNGSEIPTTSLFTEVAGRHFELDEVLTYPVMNRYMSYTRKNGANISREYVLVLRRTNTAADFQGKSR